MNDPIFLLGAHKSGTSLLRSLFDGHEQVFPLPVETHFARHLGWWTRYPLKVQTPKSNLSRNDFINSSIQWVKECNRADDQYGDSRAKGIFDEAIFGSRISDLKEGQSESIIIETYFQALVESIRELAIEPTTRIIEKSVENSEHALKLKQLFPGAKFIHILRNPYSNLVTLRKYMQKLHPSYPHLDKLIKSVYDSFFYARKNSESMQDYRVVLYEELVIDTEGTMKNLAEFLGIRFGDSLLNPSFLGKPWSGNSVSGSSFKGVSNERLNPWIHEINSLEINTVNKFLGEAVQQFSYDTIPDRKGAIWPMKRERIKEYLANRVNLKRPF